MLGSAQTNGFDDGCVCLRWDLTEGQCGKHFLVRALRKIVTRCVHTRDQIAALEGFTHAYQIG
jgi:hypothetical protein